MSSPRILINLPHIHTHTHTLTGFFHGLCDWLNPWLQHGASLFLQGLLSQNDYDSILLCIVILLQYYDSILFFLVLSELPAIKPGPNLVLTPIKRKHHNAQKNGNQFLHLFSQLVRKKFFFCDLPTDELYLSAKNHTVGSMCLYVVQPLSWEMSLSLGLKVYPVGGHLHSKQNILEES